MVSGIDFIPQPSGLRPNLLTTRATGECSVENCGGKKFSRGLCKRHYARWYKDGVVGFRVCICCSQPITRLNGSKFCSKECYKIANFTPPQIGQCENCGSDFEKKSKNHRFCCSPDRDHKTLKCLYCSTPFHQRLSTQLYCSRVCKIRCHSMPDEQTTKNCCRISYCRSCRCIIRGEGVFCSNACRPKKKPKQLKPPRESISCTCLICSRAFLSVRHQRFCSRRCNKLDSKRRARKTPHGRIIRRLAKRLRGLIKTGRAAHRAGISRLTGCSSIFLAKWIEQAFQLGMSWQNYGEWHIDHIRPCASFDLTDLKQQKKCFHYTNLRPLWSAENIAKSDKVPTQVEFCITGGHKGELGPVAATVVSSNTGTTETIRTEQVGGALVNQHSDLLTA